MNTPLGAAPPLAVHPQGAEGAIVNSLFEIPQAWYSAKFTPRRLQNIVQARLEHGRGALMLDSLPIKLTIESTNICNLRCTACFTGVGKHGRARGHMTEELYAWLMRELGPTLFEVELHNWGEPLLGRNVYRFLEMTRDAGVSSTISTNFSVPFDDERAERLVTSGLGTLGLSIDGATQEVYEKYRVRGDLALVLENTRRVVEAKRRLGSVSPHIYWAYHVFPHNVHEVETARLMAQDLGVHFAPSRAWLVGESDETTSDYGYPFGDGDPSRCFFLWYQAVVHHDGGVAPCCGTFYQEDDFYRLPLDPEALATRSFKTIWNSEYYVEARRLYYGKPAEGKKAPHIACTGCAAVTDYQRWTEAKRTGAPFKKATSNEGFNFFWGRTPEDGPKLVQLTRKPTAE